jgi:hypothetical protein
MRSPTNFYISFSPHGVPLYRRMEGASFTQLAMWDKKGGVIGTPRPRDPWPATPMGPIWPTPKALGAPHPYPIRGWLGLSGLPSGRSPLRSDAFIN